MRVLVLLLALLGLTVPARAQSALAGTDLRLKSLASPPSNLAVGTGNAGIWNNSGVFSWIDSTGASTKILVCGICTVSVSELTIAGTVHSTTGGIKFPDNTVQTTAAAGNGNLFYDELTIFESCRNTGTGVGAVPANGSAAEKDGLAVYFTTGVHVTGLTFYWNSAAPSRTIEANLNLYWSSTQTSLATASTTTGTGGEITVTFSSPVAVTAYTPVIVWFMDPSGNENIQPCDNNPNAAFIPNNGSLAPPFLMANTTMELGQFFSAAGVTPGNTTPPQTQLGSTRHFPIRVNYTIP